MLRKNTVEYLILHHAGGTDAQPLADSSNYTVKQCDADHRIRFPSMRSSTGYYVGYHYFIDKNGIVTQTRKDDEEGAHTVGKNSSSIGICLAGNFDAFYPTPEQIDALRSLLKSKMTLYSVPVVKIVPHRAFASKTCYGRNLRDTWGQELLIEKPIPVPELTTEDSCKVYLAKQSTSTQFSFFQWLWKIIQGKL